MKRGTENKEKQGDFHQKYKQTETERNLLESIKLQYLQISELECQALAEEAEFGKEPKRPPRKVIFNTRDDVWDFRSDIEIPWLSTSGERRKLPGVSQTGDNTAYFSGVFKDDFV